MWNVKKLNVQTLKLKADYVYSLLRAKGCLPIVIFSSSLIYKSSIQSKFENQRLRFGTLKTKKAGPSLALPLALPSAEQYRLWKKVGIQFLDEGHEISFRPFRKYWFLGKREGRFSREGGEWVGYC